MSGLLKLPSLFVCVSGSLWQVKPQPQLGLETAPELELEPELELQAEQAVVLSAVAAAVAFLDQKSPVPLNSSDAQTQQCHPAQRPRTLSDQNTSTTTRQNLMQTSTRATI